MMRIGLLSYILPLILSSATSSPSQQENFLKLITSFRQDIPNFECEYEGSRAFIREGDREDVYQIFTGKYISRKDGSYLADIYRRHTMQGSLVRESIVVWNNETRTISGPGDRPRDRQSLITATNSADFIRDATPGQVLCLDYLIRLLQYSNKVFEPKGRQFIDEVPCEVVDIVIGTGHGAPASNKVTYRFWIDVVCLGFPRRVETLNWKDEAEIRLTIKNFHEFTQGATRLWLPMESTLESFLAVKSRDDPGVVTAKPVHRSFTKILPSTIKFRETIPDKTFTVKHIDGMTVSDNIRKHRYEYSRSAPGPRPGKLATRTEFEHELQEQLRIADAQRDELQASSLARSGDEATWQALSSIVSLTAVTGLAAAFFLWRRNR